MPVVTLRILYHCFDHPLHYHSILLHYLGLFAIAIHPTLIITLPSPFPYPLPLSFPLPLPLPYTTYLPTYPTLPYL